MHKTFLCGNCQNFFLAHEFVEQINRLYGLRELRLLCKSCIPQFKRWGSENQHKYLRIRLEEYFGAEQYIYSLNDPLTKKIRYIGRSKKPNQRFTRHLVGLSELLREVCGTSSMIKIDCNCEVHQARTGENSSRYWIADLARRNLKPILMILERVEPPLRVVEREMRWIAFLIQQKTRLNNAENQSPKLVKLIRRRKDSLLEILLENLTASGFTQDYHRELSHLNKYSGWVHAEFIDAVYRDKLKIDGVR